MSGAPRAGILVTGTEVLTGRVKDRNGPWLAERLWELGVDLAYTTIVGDRPEDLESALRYMAAEGLDLILTSGGLGPTADDLTAEVWWSRAQGARDGARRGAGGGGSVEILEGPLAKRWPNLDMDAIRRSNRKQAVIPRGATVLEPVGTAPGLVVPPGGKESQAARGPTVVVLLRPSLREAAADVERGGEDRGAARGDRGCDRVPAEDAAAVRDTRVQRSPRRLRARPNERVSS